MSLPGDDVLSHDVPHAVRPLAHPLFSLGPLTLESPEPL